MSRTCLMRLWCQLQELLKVESPVTIERMGIADIKVSVRYFFMMV
jgi:hypothetical protein